MITKRMIDTFVQSWNATSKLYVEDFYINSGWCYQLAVVAQQLLDPNAKFQACECHAWVVINGKNYDVNHRRGTTENLCIVGRCEVKTMSLAQLEKKCKRWGNSGPISWDAIELAVKSYRTNAPIRKAA